MKEIIQSINNNLKKGRFKMSDYPEAYQQLSVEQIAQIIEDEIDIAHVSDPKNKKGQLPKKQG